MFTWIKSIFGKYETDHEYWVRLDQIKISPDFAATTINKYKWSRKFNYFLRTGKLESRIILGKDFVLKDGYSSYLIAQKAKFDKVRVYFED